jgi:hypothetical protein
MTPIKLDYRFGCAYLWYFLQVEHLTGEQIQERVSEIQEWLDETCTYIRVDWLNKTPEGYYPEIKTYSYQWAKDTSDVYLYHNPFANSATLYNPNYYGDWTQVFFPNTIAFRHAEDLLAFKLKFGIEDGIENPRK